MQAADQMLNWMLNNFAQPPEEPTMLDLTKPAQTRDGRPVRLLCTDAGSRYPVVGLVQDPDGNEALENWALDGRVLNEPGVNASDLVNVPVQHSGWINIRKVEGKLASSLLRASQVYSTRHEADLHARPTRITCVFVSFTEGEGL